jgi:hypothetical protein
MNTHVVPKSIPMTMKSPRLDKCSFLTRLIISFVWRTCEAGRLRDDMVASA